jgi:hypothetical protein
MSSFGQNALTLLSLSYGTACMEQPGRVPPDVKHFTIIAMMNATEHQIASF